MYCSSPCRAPSRIAEEKSAVARAWAARDRQFQAVPDAAAARDAWQAPVAASAVKVRVPALPLWALQAEVSLVAGLVASPPAVAYSPKAGPRVQRACCR